MPTVLIPSLLRPLTRGQRAVRVAGATLAEVIDNLEAEYPGLRERICDGDRIQPSLSLAVDGEATQSGLLQPVSESSEVQILPAISGG
jgi:molybdopterin synthase sulfur carrier subunit